MICCRRHCTLWINRHDEVTGENEWKGRGGMRVSKPKTEFMDFAFEQNSRKNREPISIGLPVEELERVQDEYRRRRRKRKLLSVAQFGD